MKRYFIIAILIISSTISSFATTYFLSSSSGSDQYSSIQAQNINTPWKSTDKLNAVLNTIKPGDSILFKSGDTFFGSLDITVSGTINMPIVFSSYGTGSKPVITGFTTMTNWVSIGNGIYESANPNLGSVVNTVLINNTPMAKGRYPNSGYLTFQSHNVNTSITDNQSSTANNWTGAELVVRTTHWVIDRSKIISQSGGTISYAQPLSYEPIDNFGYFIQNDIRTLDQMGEWFYNAATKKLDVYFGSSNPASFDVKAPFANTLIKLYNNSNISFNNLSFKGSNVNTFDIATSSNDKIINCDILYSGTDAITGSEVTNMRIENNNIQYSNNNGIYLGYNCYYNSIKNNSIKNTLMFPGMCTSGNTTGLGIFVRGKSNSIQYNTIDSSGFTPIRFAEDSNLIQNNLITNFNFVKDDEGAIYTYNNNPGAPVNYGRKITNNIIINGIGANPGTDGNNSADGIYMDDNSGGVEISGNTISNCNNNGIYIHDAHDMVITNNTSYNNGNSQIIFKYDNIAPNGVIRNIQNNNNIFFSKKTDQMVAKFQSISNDFGLMGAYNFNYYCRPLNDNFSILTRDVNGTEITYDLDSWKKLYGKDADSKISPVQISSYKINSLSTTNKFTNGTFNTDLSGMYVYSTATSYSKSWATGKLDGGSFQGTIASASPSTYSPILAIGSIDGSKQYILRFSAISNMDTVFNVYLRQSNAPYNTISDIKTFHITPSRKEYEYLFSFPATEADASIGFETASQNLNFWMDNIKLYEASASVTNPDDSIRFEYNGTSSSKTISLDKNYIDVKNNKYSGALTLQPFTSIILLKDTSSAKVNLPAPSINILNPLSNAIFNINSNILITTLSAAGTDGGYISKIDFYANGILMGTVTKAPFNIALKNLAAGNYVLTAKATADNGVTNLSAPVNVTVKPIIISPSSINIHSSIGDSNMQELIQIKVGPNPASNLITVYTQGFKPDQNMLLTIFDMSGMEVKRIQGNSSNPSNRIDISQLSAGVYNLKIICGNEEKIKRFVKQ